MRADLTNRSPLGDLMTATTLPGLDRVADALDLVIAEAVLLNELGPVEAFTVDRLEGLVRVRFTPAAVSAMAVHGPGRRDALVPGWLELVCPTLEEETVAVTGEAWRPEVQVAMEVFLAERAEELIPALAQAAKAGAVTFEEAVSPGQVLATGCVNATLAGIL